MEEYRETKNSENVFYDAPQDKAVCKHCGVTLNDEQKYCYNCGKKVTKPNNKKTASNNALGIVKKSLILIVAIFMVITIFCPIISLEINDYSDDNDIKINFGAVDAIVMFANSMLNLDTEDVFDQLDYLKKDALDYYNEWRDGKEINKLVRFVKDAINISMRAETQKIGLENILLFAFSFAQIVLSLLLIIFAIISFVSIFNSEMKDFTNASLKILIFNLIIVFINAYVFKYAFGLPILESEVFEYTFRLYAFRLYAPEIKSGRMQIWVYFIALISLLAMAVLRRVVNKEKIAVGTLVKHAFSLFFSVVLLVSVFAPIVSTEVKTAFVNSSSEGRHATAKMDGGLFYAFNISEEEKDTYCELDDNAKEQVIASNYFKLRNYTKLEFTKGEANAINQEIYSQLLLSFGAYEYCFVFVLGAIAMIFVAAFAFGIICHNAYELATGNPTKLFLPITAKVLAILMSLIIIAIVIVSTVFVNFNAHQMDISYDAKIAYGPIMMLIASIGLICVPPAISKK